MYKLANGFVMKRVIKVFMQLSHPWFVLTLSLHNQHLEVTQPTPQEDEVDVDRHDITEHETLQNLLALDPFLHTVFIFLSISLIKNMKNGLNFPFVVQSTWQCTATITRVQEQNNWWFPSCYGCGRSCVQQSKTYNCSKCGSTKTSYRWVYRSCHICFIKTVCNNLFRSYSPRVSLTNIASSTSLGTSSPFMQQMELQKLRCSALIALQNIS
jgi:hypothetical protein